MLQDFLLAVALICPAENVVQVQEVITTRPIDMESCLEATHDAAKRKQYLPEKAQTGKGCELDLICVRVRWEE